MTFDHIKVVSVNVSTEKGTIKEPVPKIIIHEQGIVGDAHAGPWHRQVSLLAWERIEQFSKEAGREIKYGEFAENITTQGIDLEKVCLLDRFKIGEVELEVTQIGKKCHGQNCAIFREVGNCIMPKEGIFCRVIRGGAIQAGDAIDYLPRKLQILIITLSDRASRGEYEDLSGPKIKTLLEEFFRDKQWRTEIEKIILPDDVPRLKEELEKARDTGVDVIFTTGGTGIGPRDITPDVVLSLSSRIIPGIMEQIRQRFGQQNPNAYLSRSVAGMLGASLIYTLPGSVRAVQEYMEEILITLEHLILMSHGLDVHR